MENFHLLLHAHWGHELLPLPSTGRGPWAAGIDMGDTLGTHMGYTLQL